MTSVDRLDQHLVRAGLARSRNVAQRLIRAGAVTVDGARVDKPSYAVGPAQRVTVADHAAHQWVGRGALKLEYALITWGQPREAPVTAGSEVRRTLGVAGRRCLDVGASTGGFTQVLLAHGASHVTALDVGHDQLVAELAADPRVRDLSGTNIRDADPAQLGQFDLVVGDVSFISLTLVLPPVLPLLGDGADVVFLVKPQFEVGRDRLARDGVVTSPAEHARVLNEVVQSATSLGLDLHGIERSPVVGTHGNREYLLWLASSAPGMMSADETAARVRELCQPPEPEDNR